jgi:NAD(P)-dependent dehydrogenase (short-subunit alcohol dehydrogenase family)
MWLHRSLRTVLSMTTTHRTALVTGASQGLGLALAHRLTEQGWAVVVDGRHAASLTDAAASFSGPQVVPVTGDVADPAHRRQLADAAASLGGVDLLVLNAGTLGPSPLPPIASTSLDELRTTLELNVVAQVGVVQALLPHLRPQATIIAVTSDAAVEGYEGWGAYGASKAALEQAMHVLGAERPDLRVLRVDPGDMRTAMHQAAFPGEDISDRPPPEASVPGIIALVTGSQPSGRYQARALATTEEVPV